MFAALLVFKAVRGAGQDYHGVCITNLHRLRAHSYLTYLLQDANHRAIEQQGPSNAMQTRRTIETATAGAPHRRRRRTRMPRPRRKRAFIVAIDRSVAQLFGLAVFAPGNAKVSGRARRTTAAQAV
ncbi:MAG: hypothetical protein AAGJ91_00570 [Pseudomonadota bacterium]